MLARGLQFASPTLEPTISSLASMSSRSSVGLEVLVGNSSKGPSLTESELEPGADGVGMESIDHGDPFKVSQ